jgi:6-phosphogluconolactonase/glucosamine-6-phosphate isomerase/deaminase
MNYRYIPSTDTVSEYLAETLQTHLAANEDVLWLVSGGSAIATAVAVADKLKDSDLSGLSVSLVDERYGTIGHSAENWRQLLEAGFKLPTAQLYRPLTGHSRAETTMAFNLWLAEHITHANYSIGLFGIGTDGHTAGIKPGTASVDVPEWETDFDGADFERITMTPRAIEQLNEAVLLAMGPEKSEVIDQLLHQNLPLTVQPAQVLKMVKKSTLFTDYKENTL